MTPKTTTKSLILATFALVGVMTSGAIVPAAFAQTVDPFTDEGGLLDQFLADDGGTDSTTDSTTDSGSITDGTESTDETQNQATSQDETNNQSNSLDQDQTGAINQEIASGEDSEAASAADSGSESTSESTYKTKSKSDSTSSYPGTSDSTSDSISDSISDVSNTGTLGQQQELSNPTQVNTNNAGDDESRSATVGFDLGFEQFTEQDSTVPGIGTSVPIVIPR
jgi:ABC-type Na+ efflux pump permease subunit